MLVFRSSYQSSIKISLYRFCTAWHQNASTCMNVVHMQRESLFQDEILNNGCNSSFLPNFRGCLAKPLMKLSRGLLNIIHIIELKLSLKSPTSRLLASTVRSGADQRKYQDSASLDFVRGIHQWQMDSPHEGPATRKYFHLMTSSWCANGQHQPTEVG